MTHAEWMDLIKLLAPLALQLVHAWHSDKRQRRRAKRAAGGPGE